MRDPNIPDHAISLPNKFFEAAAAKKPILASSGTFVENWFQSTNLVNWQITEVLIAY